MSRKLAIKGHPTRGKEVIELLEMMGGNTFNSCIKIAYSNRVYYIGNNNAITWDYIGPEEIDKYDIFTLEEFLKKYPYKVGDKAVYIDDNDIVVISEIEWVDTVGDIFYNVKRIDEDDCFLCPPELLKPFDTVANHIMRPEVNADGMLCYKIPNGYESFSVQEGMIILKSIKSKYPKTFEECLNMLYCKSIFVKPFFVMGAIPFYLQYYNRLLINCKVKIAKQP